MITPSESGSILSDTIADLIVAHGVGTGVVHNGRPKDAAGKKKKSCKSQSCVSSPKDHNSVDKINTPTISFYFF